MEFPVSHLLKKSIYMAFMLSYLSACLSVYVFVCFCSRTVGSWLLIFSETKMIRPSHVEYPSLLSPISDTMVSSWCTAF